MARRGTSPLVKTLTAEGVAGRLVRITDHYYNAARQARWIRWQQNIQNWDAHYHRMDWSHKRSWQTQQTVPDFGIAIEQTVGVFERALTDADDWLTTDPAGIGDPPLDPETIQHLLLYYLRRLWVPGDAPETAYGIGSLVGDAIKRGLLESIVTFKVYARTAERIAYRLEPARPVPGPLGHPTALAAYDLTAHGPPGRGVERVTIPDLRLVIELVPFEDYYPDWTLANLYCLHEVTRTVTELLANPDYDPAAVLRCRGAASATLADAYKRRSQNIPYVQHETWEGRIREGWGDVVDPSTGEVLETNCFWTVCNGELLRPPTPNPFWHQKRPFVSCPLLPTPNSTVHKALADPAVALWRFMNELISLMCDGAIGSVFGIKQIRPEYLQYPDEVSEGVPQAATLTVKDGTPEGIKVIEPVETGQFPQYALEMFTLAQREFQTAMITSDLRLGQLPPRQVKATEIVQAMEAAGSLFESIAARFEERALEPVFELAWATILQYEDDLIEPELVAILGPERTLALQRLSPAERFVLLAQAAKFRVRGIRGVAAKNRTLTKLANFLQLLQSNPDTAFAQAFWAKYSKERYAEQLLKGSGIDPTTIELTGAERRAAQEAQDRQQAGALVERLRQEMHGGAPEPAPAPPPAAAGAPAPGASPGPPPAAPGPAAAPPGMLETAMAPTVPGAGTEAAGGGV